MKNLFKRLLLSFFILMPAILFAQNDAASTVPDEKIHFEKKASPGTYQFLVSVPDSQFVFTNDILIQIENLRKEKDEVIVIINSFVKVRILSRSEITSGNFKPVEEIMYVEQ
jgi:hypothetical protein